ncbi:MAG: hypothetical protein GX685_05170 [Clostridiales bacterium]|nr:hypothetical protein [Clostridiales bacterium]
MDCKKSTFFMPGRGTRFALNANRRSISQEHLAGANRRSISQEQLAGAARRSSSHEQLVSGGNQNK